MIDYILSELAKVQDVISAMRANAQLVSCLEGAAKECVIGLKRGNKILLVGNGGSAADAQHIAAELVGRFAFDRPGLAAMALTTDTSILTAVGNDYGYERVFARQVEAIGNKGDILIAYSTSGRSDNILRALEAARAKGLICIGLTGSRDGPMGDLCHHLLAVAASNVAEIQVGHLVVGHILCGLIENALFR